MTKRKASGAIALILVVGVVGACQESATSPDREVVVAEYRLSEAGNVGVQSTAVTGSLTVSATTDRKAGGATTCSAKWSFKNLTPSTAYNLFGLNANLIAPKNTFGADLDWGGIVTGSRGTWASGTSNSALVKGYTHTIELRWNGAGSPIRLVANWSDVSVGVTASAIPSGCR